MPLSDSSSSAGIRTRALEIYGKPIEDEELAVEVHQTVRDNYSTPGPIFVKKVIEVREREQELFSESYDMLFKYFTKKWSDRISSYVSAVAIVMLADILSSEWIFGVGAELATEQAFQLGDDILNYLESVKEIDDASRAYQFFMSWFASNYEHFADFDFAVERYGFQQGGAIFMYPKADGQPSGTIISNNLSPIPTISPSIIVRPDHRPGFELSHRWFPLPMPSPGP